jgi:signal transduction histidine kinase
MTSDPNFGEDEDRLKDLSQVSSACVHFLINAFSAVVSNAELIRARASRMPEGAALDDLGLAVVNTALDASKVARKWTEWARILCGDREADARIEPVDVNELVREIVGTCEQKPASSITWNLELGVVPSVAGDRRRIRSMLDHVTQNAIEAQSLTEAVISISTRTEARGWAVLTIADSGPGMTPEILRRATEPFYTTKPDHAGIGLTLAQTICRRHRGSLTIETLEGAGTTIRMQLPPAPADQGDGSIGSASFIR